MLIGFAREPSRLVSGEPPATLNPGPLTGVGLGDGIPALYAVPIGGDTSAMKTVAIIGASNDRSKFGNKAVRAYLQQGYTVYPINPHESEIEGLPAFKSIRDVPVRPQRISLYVPPPIVLKLLPDIAAVGCDELWLNPGTESDEVLAQATQLGMNIVQACSIVDIGVSPSRI